MEVENLKPNCLATENGYNEFESCCNVEPDNFLFLMRNYGIYV